MKILHVAGEYPCARASKFSLALGIQEAVSRRPPSAFPEAFSKVTWRSDADAKWFRDQIAASDADVIMLHAELYSSWMAEAVREGAGKRPLIVNSHDVTAARTGYVADLYEHLLYEIADALIFCTPEQEDFARGLGFDLDKPSIIIPNYPSSTMFVGRKMLPHLGGIVYEGGLDPRGAPGAWRDLSAVSDELESAGTGLHIYPANPGVDYGILHEMVLDYRILIHRLAQHDWGFSGTPKPEISWMHSSPNKVYDYFCAGIPVIFANMPRMMPLVEMGMGVHIDDVKHLKSLPDAKKLKKSVMANRSQFTMEREIDKVVELAESL